MIHCKVKPLIILAFASSALLSRADTTQTLPTLYIDAQQTANTRPVTTYESAISNLEFEPRVDLQSRNMSEAQGDVTIRGGIFESTGFRVGSATLIDPQTGHYFAELPIAPEMLERAEVLTGNDNALYGFNSTVGTINYGWSQIADGGSLTVGGGDHDLNFQRIHHGMTSTLGESGEWSWGIEAEVSRSESDGTLEFGDSDFDRTTGRVQILGPNSQTDFFAGYQSKFFGWPELYAASFGSNETENLKTRLFIVNHHQNYGDDSYWEATAYSRRNTDHYIYNRFAPNKAFVHETDVHSLGLSGKHAFDQSLSVNYQAQFTADQIESTTLEHSFTSRSYYKLSILPEYQLKLSANESLTLRAGGTLDDTSRDDDELSALFDITWLRSYEDNKSDSVYLAYAESSQVAGYTAIGGLGGLFLSNPDLNRETSQNLEFGTQLTRQNWSFEAAIFYRWDDDLVDWTYSNGSPNARAANNVDIETFGFELIGTKRWGDVEGIASYTYLHKDEDYGDASIDASFYALNYAKHRVTLGAIWSPNDIIEIRIDNEWRENEANALRNGSDSALFTHFGLSIYPPAIAGLELFFAIDNAWDDGFEDVPGTPGRGDQYSAGATFRW
ncbi:TonB-dependent receptor [Coraliomargarita algicola]|uniref:TonB-dependent receptor n=1 Tax=Coraliomargarita algicola TaxID=3092156 RepID=A0ABZ0RNP9_9BACT|nr:TonB-dependent receptor [Coraliomargarita sp. J2-16]WPJ97856.1 TonB-dependent receptor [Coraliomargarita sp. J2-16]